MSGMAGRRSRISGRRFAAPLSPLDPRIAPWRPDLADIALAGLVAVPHYAAPVLRSVAAESAMLHTRPEADSEAASELLHGETFAVLEEARGWAWGQARADGYVGYVRTEALAPALGPPAGPVWDATVGPGDALRFAAPAVKAPVVGVLPAGSRLHVREADEAFVMIADGSFAGQFVHRRHLLPAGGAADPVEVAKQFLGAPYRWGGRTRAGVDCSGLVQMAWRLCGRPARRDSDMLVADAGPEVPPEERARGDLAWWPGHVGLLVDSGTLLHANAHWMAVVVEPLADVVARIGTPARCRRPMA
ncbi:MAG: C40 family peptidase [Thermaurantiacus tibetensis]|uniref:C40 family peptidase n=1 Tax=Thermaurantiacus tibetensis TaxID=2759035 RepID=UPI001F3AE060|nr:NlpC/P60 family protein [Thermaurantiacus tibetensis]